MLCKSVLPFPKTDAKNVSDLSCMSKCLLILFI